METNTMYSRYDVRNACFRMQKGLDPKKPELREKIQKKLENTGFGLASFAKDWDVVVNKGIIRIISSITNVTEVKEVCSKRQMIEELGVDKEWDGREKAIIDAVEAQFLEGIMDWSNYKVSWDVRNNSDRNTIETYLLTVKPYQISQEEIDAKLQEMMKPTEESIPKDYIVTLDMSDAQPLSDEEAAKLGLDKPKPN